MLDVHILLREHVSIALPCSDIGADDVPLGLLIATEAAAAAAKKAVV